MNHDKDKAGGIPRIAILGIHLEANGFAPPTVRADFTSQCWEEGEAITRLARQDNVSERMVAAVDAMIASHIDLGWCDNYKKYLFNFAKHRRPEHYGLIVERTGVGASIFRKKTP